MDVEWWKISLGVAQFVLTGVVVYWVNHDQARRQEVRRLADRLDQRLDDVTLRLDDVTLRQTRLEAAGGNSPSLEACAAHRGRVDMIERLLSERPGHEDMKRVHARIDEWSAVVSEVRGRLGGIERSLSLLTEHLLDQSVRGDA